MTKLFFTLVLISIQIVYADAQKNTKTGWVNSVSFGVGTNNEFDSPYEFEGTIQLEYLRYKQHNERLGFGGGLTLTTHYGLYGYHNHVGNHTFGDVFVYGKSYFTKKRQKSFIDVKLGYGYGLDTEKYYCDDCPNNISEWSYKSTYMIQSGIGTEFSIHKKMKWGIKLSPHLLKTARGNRVTYIGALIFGSSLSF